MLAIDVRIAQRDKHANLRRAVKSCAVEPFAEPTSGVRSTASNCR